MRASKVAGGPASVVRPSVAASPHSMFHTTVTPSSPHPPPNIPACQGSGVSSHGIFIQVYREYGILKMSCGGVGNVAETTVSKVNAWLGSLWMLLAFES